MNAFPRQKVSLRRVDSGRAVLEAECGFGLAIVPVDEARTRLGSSPTIGGTGQGDRVVRVKGFTFYHQATGMQLLPKGWFFTSIDAARAALAAIGARWPSAFDTHDINQFVPLCGPVMDLVRRCHVVAGKWSDLSRALDGVDEDEWHKGADDRAARIAAMPDDRRNHRRNAEAA